MVTNKQGGAKSVGVMKTKYIVWIHQNEGSSTGTAPMSAKAARDLEREEERSLIKPNGGLPQWPRIEIRRADNPPTRIAK